MAIEARGTWLRGPPSQHRGCGGAAFCVGGAWQPPAAGTASAPSTAAEAVGSAEDKPPSPSVLEACGGSSAASSALALAGLVGVAATSLRRASRRQRAARAERCLRRAELPGIPRVNLEVGEKVVGIDLGTTNSLVAVCEAGEPRVVPNREGERLTPSAVAYVGKDGSEVLVGRAAKRQAALNPKNTFFSVKRLLGRRYEEVGEVIAHLPYTVTNEFDKEVRIDCPAIGKKLTPEDISARVLEKLRDDAASYLNCTINKAVISVPAYFDDSQRQATKLAGKLAGIDVLRICNEPTMAAVAYGLDLKNQSIIAVLDLGGGTFDMAILEVGNGVMEVAATNGITDLGGDNFDECIIEWLAEGFLEREGIDLRKDPQAQQRLREAAERAKSDLSTLPEVEISVPFVAADANGPMHVNEILTRKKFEELTAHLLVRIGESINSCIKSAFKASRVGPVQIKYIDELALVGGASRMPCFERKVLEILPKPVNNHINADEAIAIGCALQSSMISGELTDIMLLDVTPLTLGVETNGGVFTPVIERGRALPCKQLKLFTTSGDAQAEIEVNVLQGERPFAKDNKMLGTLRLSGIPPAPAGVPKVEVEFDINLEGILSVRVKDWATRQTVRVKFDGIVDVTDDEVDEVFEDAEKHFMKDEDDKERTELRYAAECLVDMTRDNFKDLGRKLPPDFSYKIEPKIDRLEMSIKGKALDEIDYKSLKDQIDDTRFDLMFLAQRIWGVQLAPDNRPGPGKPRPAGGMASSSGGSGEWFNPGARGVNVNSDGRVTNDSKAPFHATGQVAAWEKYGPEDRKKMVYDMKEKIEGMRAAAAEKAARASNPVEVEDMPEDVGMNPQIK